MLSIFFGYDETAILSVDTYFNNVYEEEWLDDAFVRRMVMDVDGSEVVSSQCIVSPVLGQIPPERLSGGVKALICLYAMDDFYPDLIVCGENCEPFILEIAEQKNIRCALSGYDISFETMREPILCLNDGTLMEDRRAFTEKMLKLVGAGHEG